MELDLLRRLLIETVHERHQFGAGRLATIFGELGKSGKIPSLNAVPLLR